MRYSFHTQEFRLGIFLGFFSTKAPADDTSSSCTHGVVRVRRAKRDTDRTSESECDSGKENRRRSRMSKHPHSITSKVTLKETKDRGSDRYFSVRAYICLKRFFFSTEILIQKLLISDTLLIYVRNYICHFKVCKTLPTFKNRNFIQFNLSGQTLARGLFLYNVRSDLIFVFLLSL